MRNFMAMRGKNPMQETRIDIRNHKARNKFCLKMNKFFGCKDAYLCNISCPFYLWYETVLLMDSKNLSLGEAFRLSTRQSITPEERRKIFRDRIGAKKEYPREGSK